MKIAIGGMISSGKSTLVKGLAEKLGYTYMDEFAEDDEVFHTLLKWLYEGKEDVEMLLQIYFLHKHWKTQKEQPDNVIVDRDIIEHWIFAQENIKDKPEVLNMYNGVFHAYMNTHKKPDLYVILDINWTEFKKRIHKRGRAQEIDNFERNEKYFLTLLGKYTKMMKAQCIIHDIPYTVVSVNDKSEVEVLEEVMRHVRFYKDIFYEGGIN